MALSTQDDWLKYLNQAIDSLDYELGGSEWTKHIIDFLEKQQQNLRATKFKGQLFYYKFSNDRKNM